MGRRDLEGLVNILQRMLVIDAEARPSAADCLREASKLVISSQDYSTTPTPASYTPMRHISLEGQGGDSKGNFVTRLTVEQVCRVQQQPFTGPLKSKKLEVKEMRWFSLLSETARTSMDKIRLCPRIWSLPDQMLHLDHSVQALITC